MCNFVQKKIFIVFYRLLWHFTRPTQSQQWFCFYALCWIMAYVKGIDFDDPPLCGYDGHNNMMSYGGKSPHFNNNGFISMSSSLHLMIIFVIQIVNAQTLKSLPPFKQGKMCNEFWPDDGCCWWCRGEGTRPTAFHQWVCWTVKPFCKNPFTLHIYRMQ